ncbi:interleukin-15 receptor subunit alpha isoform X2 [Rhinoderma darwinii]
MNLYSESYELNSHLRYSCDNGYKRQAGTSNLAICQFNDKTQKADWKYGNISCIRDPLIPITTLSTTISPFTTSVSGPSQVSTLSSTTVERLTTMSSTQTAKIHETLHNTQGKVTQPTQIPGHTPLIRLSTAPRRTHSPETVKTITNQTTVSTNTAATVTENTGYSATVKQSTTTDFITSVRTTLLTDTQESTWQKTEPIVVGNVVGIILLIVVIILVMYCRKKRSEASSIVLEHTQFHLHTNHEDNSPASNMLHEESEEETFL